MRPTVPKHFLGDQSQGRRRYTRRPPRASARKRRRLGLYTLLDQFSFVIDTDKINGVPSRTANCPPRLESIRRRSANRAKITDLVFHTSRRDRERHNPDRRRRRRRRLSSLASLWVAMAVQDAALSVPRESQKRRNALASVGRDARALLSFYFADMPRARETRAAL